MSHMLNKSFQSKCYAYRTGVQNIFSGILTLVQLNTINYDLLNEYDEVGLYQFVPLQAGYYCMTAQLSYPALPIGTLSLVYIYISGVDYANEQKVHNGLTALRHQVTLQAYLTPADIVNVRTFQNSGANQNVTGAINLTYLQIFRFG